MISNVERVFKRTYEEAKKEAIKERDKEIAKIMLEDNKHYSENY